MAKVLKLLKTLVINTSEYDKFDETIAKFQRWNSLKMPSTVIDNQFQAENSIRG